MLALEEATLLEAVLADARLAPPGARLGDIDLLRVLQHCVVTCEALNSVESI